MKRFLPEVPVPERAIIAEEKKKSFIQIYWSRLKGFLNAPKVHFVYEESFFVFFLVLFSYVLLCEFNYYGYESEEIKSTTIQNDENSTISLLNFTEESKEMSTMKKIIGPSIAEWILMFWVFSFIFDELFQVMNVYSCKSCVAREMTFFKN